jgi:WD40 repeat protein
MFLLALLLAAPAEDLQARLRHLEAVAAAWAPAPSPDGTRVAFLTTLFGTRQAASVALEGSYPLQLTDESEGVLAVRSLPPEAKEVVVALRGGRPRLLLVDDEGSAPVPIDPQPGDQFLGGTTRDGKKLFYAVQSEGKVSLRTFTTETRQIAEVTPPPPAAGRQPAAGTLALEDALSGLFALGPPTADGRSLLALVRRDGSEGVVLLDTVAARGDLLVSAEKPGRFRQPRFSPDGRTVYVLTDAGRQTLGVDSIAVQGHARKTVYAPAQDVEAFALSEDGHRLAVALESNGQDVFALLDFPTLRVQPMAVPPAGTLAEGGMAWDRSGERLFFGWQQADDTTDVWELRVGRGTPTRLTRSPRPGLSRDAILRPRPAQAGDLRAWLWKPADEGKPRLAVMIARQPIRPVFDKRIAALNFAGFAVLGVGGKGAERAALSFLDSASGFDSRPPLLLDPDGIVEQRSKWGGVVSGAGQAGAGSELDPDRPDLRALVRFAMRGAGH